MPLMRLVIPMFSASLGIAGAGGVSGEDYPNRPIRIIAALAGGGSDFTSRLIGQAISGPLGQPVIVDNRPGVAQGELAAKASPDGYTLMVCGGNVWTYPLLQKTSYDMVRNFATITLTDIAPNLLIVHPSMPIRSVKELIVLAKSRPGELNYGSSGAGSGGHLAAELFKSMASVNIVHIPYKGSPQALSALIAGEVQLQFSAAAPATPLVKSGRLRALAVTSAEPSALAPGIPTVAASGLSNYESMEIKGVYAPAKTPGPIINRLNQEIVRVLNRADVKAKFLSTGVEAVNSSPEQFAIMVKSEVAKWDKVIKDVGIKAD